MENKVLMPFIGLQPFLQMTKKQALLYKHGVLMPFIGLQPFLLKARFEAKDRLTQSVNALHRASAISTKMIEEIIGNATDVLMPFIGLQPFLRN